MRVSRVVKVTGKGRPTPKLMADADLAVHVHGAHSPGISAEVTWTPSAEDPEPEPEPDVPSVDPEPDKPVEIFPCYRCQGEIVEDAGKKSGYRHLDDAGTWNHAATRYRPVRDTPQA